MLCKILQDFPFSRDGIRSEPAVKGEVIDIPDSLVAGLAHERYVKPAGGAPETKVIEAAPSTTEPVEIGAQIGELSDGAYLGEAIGGFEPVSPGDIPLDWRALHWKQRVKLAEAISGAEIVGEDPSGQANAIIGPAYEAQLASKA